ncbi:MAG: hypothetical protein ACRCYY_21030 [Trueperaceae bacterium]
MMRFKKHWGMKKYWRIVLRVPILVGFAIFLLGLISFFRSFSSAPLPPLQKTIVSPTIATQHEEIELTRYERDLVELPLRVELELTNDPTQRYRAILTALRDQLSQETTRLWPEALALPDVFVLETNGTREVTLHFSFDEAIAVSVLDELRLYRSIRTTLSRNGASRVQIIVNENAETFLGHLSLENTLN